MGNRRPIAMKMQNYNKDWFTQYRYLARNESHHVLLESGRGGKYSIVGLRPFALLHGKENRLTIKMNGSTETKTGDPLLHMREWMKQFETEKHQDYPDFQGGAIGFISYDYVRYIEYLPSQAEDDLATPDLFFLVFNDVFVYDHEEKSLWLITHYEQDDKEAAEQRLKEYKGMWLKDTKEWDHSKMGFFSQKKEAVSFTEKGFKNAVETIRDYIRYGDVFQVNLSVRQTKPLTNDPLEIYSSLRKLNPSPYMAYIQTPEFQVVSGSPELLVKKKGSTVSTRPIAGTRSRGKTDMEDEKLAKELIENEKEQAEHLMLVDLERNDLGRVCKYGTVEVNEYMAIEKYSHVMHIVSNVRGELKENNDVYDIIRSVFPGGTITGAPKVRTMEIIEQLEPVRRGIYTGSIGWIDFSGDIEFNIVIRTMVVKEGLTHVQAGAGVVIDSNPTYEYKEATKKAIALWKAMEMSEEEQRKKHEVRNDDFND